MMMSTFSRASSSANAQFGNIGGPSEFEQHVSIVEISEAPQSGVEGCDLVFPIGRLPQAKKSDARHSRSSLRLSFNGPGQHPTCRRDEVPPPHVRPGLGPPLRTPLRSACVTSSMSLG